MNRIQILTIWVWLSEFWILYVSKYITVFYFLIVNPYKIGVMWMLCDMRSVSWEVFQYSVLVILVIMINIIIIILQCSISCPFLSSLASMTSSYFSILLRSYLDYQKVYIHKSKGLLPLYLIPKLQKFVSFWMIKED